MAQIYTKFQNHKLFYHNNLKITMKHIVLLNKTKTVNRRKLMFFRIYSRL
jgi:hypothetical protein